MLKFYDRDGHVLFINPATVIMVEPIDGLPEWAVIFMSGRWRHVKGSVYEVAERIGTYLANQNKDL